jgi:hypothetical protein
MGNRNPVRQREQLRTSPMPRRRRRASRGRRIRRPATTHLRRSHGHIHDVHQPTDALFKRGQASHGPPEVFHGKSPHVAFGPHQADQRLSRHEPRRRKHQAQQHCQPHAVAPGRQRLGELAVANGPCHRGSGGVSKEDHQPDGGMKHSRRESHACQLGAPRCPIMAESAEPSKAGCSNTRHHQGPMDPAPRQPARSGPGRTYGSAICGIAPQPFQTTQTHWLTALSSAFHHTFSLAMRKDTHRTSFG